MHRTVFLNELEPARLSWRQPFGVDLYLTIEFRSQRGVDSYDVIDPSTLNPQIFIMPRSKGGIYGYDMNNLTAASNISIPGTSFHDKQGYTVELYSRNSDTVPKPITLLAQGTIAVTGNAYRHLGPYDQISVPVVVGPPGPAGAPGEAGPAGARGSVWTTGVGMPTPTSETRPGDMYLDEATGDVWRFDGATWVRGSF